mgnify:CR=1 FL=1
MGTEPTTGQPALYGMLVEFEEPEDLVAAARRVRAAGYRRIDAYTPMPVHGLASALGIRRTRLPLIIATGGVIGAALGLALQIWTSAYAYPLNVGGRPLISWPSFMPVTFEMTILCAALSGVLGMLALNGLPRPYHPLFAVPEFARATQSSFFLCVEARDPLFDPVRTRELLADGQKHQVIEVENVAL